jgi:hypothetical protein
MDPQLKNKLIQNVSKLEIYDKNCDFIYVVNQYKNVLGLKNNI